MTTPAIGGKAPIAVDVKAGQDYWWCSCGQSKNQPFCDGSHKGSTFVPQKYTPAEDKKAYLCTCKKTGNAPLCDGSHKAIA
jgi:CDGSH-type Zn-finger protein